MGVLAEKDIDETMAADWAGILERHREDEPEEAEVPPVETKTEVSTIEKVRDETGKFVKAAKEPKENQQKTTEASPLAAKPVETGEIPSPVGLPPSPVSPPSPDRDVNRPPATWKPTARAEWAKLPEAVRAEIHRREGDFMSGQGQLLPDAKFGKDMRAVVDPFRMLIESEGGTPELAVQDLLRTAAILRTGTNAQKYQTIANVAQRFGVDLRAFSQAPGAQVQQPQEQYKDPRVDQLLQTMQSQEQQRVMNEHSQAQGLVSHWMNETDPQGQPKRPYVNDVISEMSVLIPQIRESNPTLSHAQALEQAYERAIWGNPEIRVLLQREQQTASEAQRRAENQQRVGEARRAASVNVPRRGSTPAAAKPGSLEETIAATARELGLVS